MSKQLRTQKPVDPVVVGKMGSAYGIRGWIRVFSFTESAESIFKYQPWFIKKISKWQPIGLENWRRHNQDLIIKMRNIEDRKSTTLFTNCEIVVDMLQFPDLGSGEYYWKDLMGCRVVTSCGSELGEVIDLIETGSNDVLVVKANLEDAFGIHERLIPFLDGKVIKNVDLTTQVIEVEWDPEF